LAFAFALAQPLDASVDATVAFAFGDSVGVRLSDGGTCILCRIGRRVRIGLFDCRRE
jgi:hypothetical protein